MTAAAILADLRARGVRLWLSAGRPLLDPPTLLQPADWANLKAVRAELIPLLAAEAKTPAPDEGWTRGDGCWLRAGLSAEDRRAALRDVRFHDPARRIDILICKPTEAVSAAN